VFAALAVADIKYDTFLERHLGFPPLAFWASLIVFAFIAWLLVQIPLKNAGSPDEPAPPSAVM
jgi:hypothetical protein